MAFDDDIIWDDSENIKKKKSTPRRQSPETEPESVDLPQQSQIPVPPAASQATPQPRPYPQAEEVFYAEQMTRRRYRRPRNLFSDFADGLRTYIFFDYLFGLVNTVFVFIFVLVVWLVVPEFRPWAAFLFSPSARQENTQQANRIKSQENVTDTNTAEQNSIVKSTNRALYYKNLSTVSQAILLLQTDGRYCSFTALGLANCFATELNVSKQEGNILYLENGAIYEFDCENQKCTVDIDININDAEIMSIPLNADDNGNIVINQKDVQEFINR